ncbi:MAG: tetratricopeptide repeat protein [bacterium]
MKNGLNTDVIYQGMTFHVQTEDMGVKNGYFQTQTYYRGKILTSGRFYYTDLISQEDFSNLLDQRIEAEHQNAIEQVENGHINIKDLEPILTPVDRSDKKSGKIKIIAESSRFLKQRPQPKSVFETSPDSDFAFNRADSVKVEKTFKNWRIPAILFLISFLFISIMALPRSRHVPSNEEKFSQYLVQGEDLVTKRDLEPAKKVLNQAISLFPNRSRAYVLRSRVHAEQGAITQSIEDLSHAVEIDPSNGAALFELGKRCFETKDLSKAIEFCKKSILADYRTQEVYLTLATALYRTGDMQEAEKAWRETLAINPENPEALYRLGVAALNKESYGEAIQNLKAAIDSDTEMTEAYLSLGDAYYQSGLKEKAGSLWTKAYELEPENMAVKIKLQNLK